MREEAIRGPKAYGPAYVQKMGMSERPEVRGRSQFNGMWSRTPEHEGHDMLTLFRSGYLRAVRYVEILPGQIRNAQRGPSAQG